MSQAFWLAVWVEASAAGLVDGVDQHLSFGPYRRGNRVPIHIFLPSGWRFAPLFWVLLLEEALLQWHPPFYLLWLNSLLGAPSFFPQTSSLTSCLCWAIEYLLFTVTASSAPLVDFGAVCKKGGNAVVALGVAVVCGEGGHTTVALGVAGLSLFLGVALLLFSVESPLLILGLVSGSGGLNWLSGVGIIGHILFSTSKKVFIFLMMLGCRWSLVVQDMHLISWVLSLLKMCVPCIEVTLTSTSTTSAGSMHLKKPCRKLHSGWSRHAI